MKKLLNNTKLRRALGLLMAGVLTVSTIVTSMGVITYADDNSADNKLSLSKTAVAVEGEDNTFDVTLTVNGTNAKTTTDVVFVIDKSNSMDDKVEGKKTRMEKTKEAAKKAAGILLNNDLTRVAVVSYNKTATTNGTFYTKDTLNALNTEIDKIKVDGGTNIQSGIKAAEDILATSNADSKCIVLLTDGQPTFAYEITSIDPSSYEVKSNCKDYWFFGIDHDLTAKMKSSYVITGVDYNKVVGAGDTSSYTSTLEVSLAGTCKHGKSVHTTDEVELENAVVSATIYEANKAKAAGYTIYGLGVDVNSQTGTNTLKSCSDKVYSATSADLEKTFSEIAGKIINAATNAVVTDPMGEKFNLVKGSVKVSQGTYKYDETSDSIKWEVGTVTEGTPATLTYKVKFDESLMDSIESGKDYPTNGTTTITYTDKEGKKASQDFDVPEVQLTKGSLKVKGYIVNEKGQPVDANGNVVSSIEDAAAAFAAYDYKVDGNAELAYGDYKVSFNKYEGSNLEFVKATANGKDTTSTEVNVSVTKQAPSQVVYAAYKTVSEVNVTYNYYKDSVSDSNKLGTDVKSEKLGSTISADTKAYAPTGYKTPGTVQEGSATVVSIDPSKNIVNVVYTKDSFGYTVNYYKDSVKTENFLGTVSGTAEFGSKVAVDKDAKLPTGYTANTATGADSVVITSDASKNVVNVVYTKKNSYGYTVEYYTEGSDKPFASNSDATAEFGSKIPYALDNVPTGYTSEGADISNANGVVTEDVTKNVVKITYKKAEFKYTVNYYKEVVNNNEVETVLVKSEDDKAKYESSISFDKNKYLPNSDYELLDSNVKGATVVSANEAENVVNITYTLKSATVVVNYYLDSKEGTLLYTNSNYATAKVGTTVKVDASVYPSSADTKLPEAYNAKGTQSVDSVVVSTDSSKNVVDVVLTKKTFTVKFVDEDGKELSVSPVVVYGDSVVTPKEPSKADYKVEGDNVEAQWIKYKFNKWVASGDYSLSDLEQVTQDMTFTASYSGQNVSIKYYVLNTGLAQPSEIYSYPAKNYSKGVAGGLHYFSESKDIDKINANLVNAPTASDFGITLEEGQTIKWYVVKKESDGYHVDGIITNQMYDLTINYVDENGNKVADSYESKVAAGTDYSVSSPVTEKYTLVAATQSTVAGTMPYNDVTVDVVYSINTYVITYVVDGEVYKTETVDYGTDVDALKAVKYDKLDESKNITDWAVTSTEDKAAYTDTKVTKPLTLTATTSTKQYTVTYLVDGVQVGDVETVDYGTELKLRDKYTIEGKEVSDWEVITGDVSSVKEDVVITANSKDIYYTVVYKVDGEVISTKDPVKYGSDISSMTQEYTAPEGYDFSGFTQTTKVDLNKVTGNVVFEGTNTLKTFTVTYMVNGVELTKVENVPYGTSIIELDDFDYEVAEGYNFSGWAADVKEGEVKVTRDIVVNGTTTLKTFTVTYMVNGVELTRINNVPYGTSIDELDDYDYEAAEGYNFSGWTVDVKEGEVKVTRDIVVNGTTTRIPDVASDEDKVKNPDDNKKPEVGADTDTVKKPEVGADTDTVKEPEVAADQESVNTGDGVNLPFWFTAMGVSIVSLAALLLTSKKKEN
ncbi:MAG: VWA domain-containing protein [Eubacteriales bacterium]|nr:VWA domain-containing protein [Eubacteriales bacterium]